MPLIYWFSTHNKCNFIQIVVGKETAVKALSLLFKLCQFGLHNTDRVVTCHETGLKGGVRGPLKLKVESNSHEHFTMLEPEKMKSG